MAPGTVLFVRVKGEVIQKAYTDEGQAKRALKPGEKIERRIFRPEGR